MDLGLNLGTLALVALLAMLDMARACVTPPMAPDAETAAVGDGTDPTVAEIAGLQWRIDRIGDMILPEGTEPFVSFAADGSARGTLVCNRFTTDFAVIGNPTATGSAMLTRAFCEGAALETRLTEALSSVAGHSLSEDGWTLTLATGEGTLELRRVDLY
jgi:heat shock protein HslJ